MAREVKEETGLEVTRTEFLFSLPNTYLYSGFLVHTVDCFFRCTVADSSLAHAMDDAAELLWIPVKELRPEDFGLASVRKGIEKLLAQCPNPLSPRETQRVRLHLFKKIVIYKV